jgi:membrane-bound lytic murein transglycosylase D
MYSEMKRSAFISIASLLLMADISFAGNHSGKNILEQIQTDTTINDTSKEDKLIDEIVHSKEPPKKEKVEYFNQVTRYGFKSLFSNTTYNSTLPYNAQINSNAEVFIQGYMKNNSKYLIRMKGWGQPYFNLIENVLNQYGLPKELKYIAVIESNLSTAATSHVGAGGPWQFMPYTAKQFGLVVNGYTDERRDYLKSSHAAAKYLLSLYKDLHDWLLVMAAYNGGPGRVYSAIKKSGSRNFWNLQYYLPEESRTYVKRFIATHYIMEGAGGVTTNVGSGTDAGKTSGSNTDNEKKILPETDPVDAEKITVTGKYNSLVIAKNLALDIALFNSYNPDFDAMLSSAGSFNLRLPPDKMELFIANKYVILNESVQILLGGANMPAGKTLYPSNVKRKHSP